MSAGDRLRTYMDAASGSKPYKLFFYTSPYLRSRQVQFVASVPPLLVSNPCAESAGLFPHLTKVCLLCLLSSDVRGAGAGV